MVAISLYPSYRDLYQQNPVLARTKVIEAYSNTMKKSLTARIWQKSREEKSNEKCGRQ